MRSRDKSGKFKSPASKEELETRVLCLEKQVKDLKKELWEAIYSHRNSIAELHGRTS